MTGFCSIHGPYDEKLNVCPYCAKNQSHLFNIEVEDNAPDEPSRPKVRKFDDDDHEETTLLGRGDDLTELDVYTSSIMGILWVRTGIRRGHIYRINDGTVIGRSAGDLMLDDPKVSNPHAKITIEDDRFIIWDFASKNGTFVNGSRIQVATDLEEDDEIKIGDILFILKILL